jgi:16S rRNA (guanine966-N2)-methyltransferase
VRETLFNWLQNDINGARCLDLFAGSGALGLEALSRGAGYVLLIDNNPQVIQQLRQNLETLQANDIDIRQADGLQILADGPGEHPFDIIFLDPPFGKGLVKPCIEALESNGWVADHARIYIETESDLKEMALPDRWEIIRDKTAGQVSYYLATRYVQ